MGGNVQIVHACGATLVFKFGANTAVVLGCFGRISEYRQAAAKNPRLRRDYVAIVSSLGAIYLGYIRMSVSDQTGAK